MRRLMPAAVAMAALIGLALGPHPATAAVTPAMPFDFNGDAYTDLAIGSPQANTRRGEVTVLYGSPTGLTAAGDQRWSQDSRGVRGSADVADRFGWATTSGDFDLDGYADLAIGVPGEVSDGVQVGAIAVLYGSAHGLDEDGDQLWMPADMDVGADLRTLGRSVAAGDINGDGYWDVVAGAPFSDNLEGAAILLFGGPGGLQAGDAQLLDRSLTGAPDGPGAYHEFGRTAAVGDLDDDGYADIAIGIDGEDNPGEVAVFPGSAAGASTSGAELWSRSTPGIQTGAGFGSSLAVADFDGDGFGDLAAGAPGDPVPGMQEGGYGAGAVHVIFGSADGLTAEGNEVWRQSSHGVPGTDEAWDRFGMALAGSDIDGDGFGDLAIGVPGEDGSDGDDGIGRGGVILLYGSSSGLSDVGVQRFTQDSTGVPDHREAGDWFGRSLAVGDYGRRGTFDLAVGAPYEDVAGVKDAGLVTVLYTRGDRLTGRNAQVWTKATDGVKGPVLREYFSWSLGT